MKIFITGGAGFIGVNAASRYLSQGHHVVILDNLARPGARENIKWLKSRGAVSLLQQDIRDGAAVHRALARHKDIGLLLHLAAQVAVTTSVADPRADFEVNALGSLNVLEAARKIGLACPMIYASTNKVYGAMEDLRIVKKEGRYAYADLPKGVNEQRPLDFHSPYGCSKGSADQYFRDYHRIYGLKTVVFRQSCIYGCRQFGGEDQGWVAWFMIAARLGLPLTVYGDGRQVRDILFIDDLLNAFDAARKRIAAAAGKVYNIGGGPENILSPLELLSAIERLMGKAAPRSSGPWRHGDQKIFVGDTRMARSELGWRPRIKRADGLHTLYLWVRDNESLLRGILSPP